METVKPVEIGRSNRYGSVKPNNDAALKLAELPGKRQRLAQAQEVIGLVAQADESCRQVR